MESIWTAFFRFFIFLLATFCLPVGQIDFTALLWGEEREDVFDWGASRIQTCTSWVWKRPIYDRLDCTPQFIRFFNAGCGEVCFPRSLYVLAQEAEHGSIKFAVSNLNSPTVNPSTAQASLSCTVINSGQMVLFWHAIQHRILTVRVAQIPWRKHLSYRICGLVV